MFSLRSSFFGSKEVIQCRMKADHMNLTYDDPLDVTKYDPMFSDYLTILLFCILLFKKKSQKDGRFVCHIIRT